MRTDRKATILNNGDGRLAQLGSLPVSECDLIPIREQHCAIRASAAKASVEAFEQLHTPLEYFVIVERLLCPPN